MSAVPRFRLPFVPLLVAVLVMLSSALRAQIFVSDYNAHTVSTYAFDGTLLHGGLISGLTANAGIAIAANGDIYVASQQGGGAGYVGQYTSTGATVNATLVSGLDGPVALALDGGGNLYIANSGGTTVSRYSAGGSFTANFITGLSSPSGLAFDSSGNIYVTNYNTGTVGKYDSSGGVIAGSFLSSLDNPFGIAISSAGDVFIANSTGGTGVSKFDSPGILMTTFNTGMNRPTALAIVGNTLYVDNQNGHNVGSYALDGTALNVSLISGLSNSFGMTAIPEPSTYAVILGALVLGGAVWRRWDGEKKAGKRPLG